MRFRAIFGAGLVDNLNEGKFGQIEMILVTSEGVPFSDGKGFLSVLMGAAIFGSRDQGSLPRFPWGKGEPRGHCGGRGGARGRNRLQKKY